MKRIHTDEAPAPAGHYSQAIEHGGLVFVSGQLPVTASGEALAEAPIGEQTALVMRNIGRILDEAGSGLDRLLQVTIYVPDIAAWPEINAAYARVMGDARPSRAVIPVRALHYGVGLEVQAVAATGAARLV